MNIIIIINVLLGLLCSESYNAATLKNSTGFVMLSLHTRSRWHFDARLFFHNNFGMIDKIFLPLLFQILLLLLETMWKFDFWNFEIKFWNKFEIKFWNKILNVQHFDFFFFFSKFSEWRIQNLWTLKMYALEDHRISSD